MKFFENMISPESDGYVEEIAAENGSGGITFLVTNGGRIFYTCERIPHRSLLARSHYSAKDIAWGGVLTEQGDWVRPSGDFGDAPDPEIRNSVVFQIQESMAT